MWNAATGKSVRQIAVPAPLTFMATVDGRFLVVRDDMKGLALFDNAKNEKIANFPTDGKAATPILSPDGKTLAVNQVPSPSFTTCLQAKSAATWCIPKPTCSPVPFPSTAQACSSRRTADTSCVFRQPTG
jgi:hypothetical protein